MSYLFEQFRNLVTMIPDPALRNGVALAICMLLYAAYVNEKKRYSRPHRRGLGNADSVLRDAVAR